MKFVTRLFDKGRRAQAVLVHLDVAGLAPAVVEERDLAALENALTDAVPGLGELDGHELGPGEATIYLYGPDAEQLFGGIESILRASPLCGNARVVIRRGAPGAAEREVRLEPPPA